jgi:hypothetical protein
MWQKAANPKYGSSGMIMERKTGKDAGDENGGEK